VAAPLDDPMSYPGRWPTAPFVIAHGTVRELESDQLAEAVAGATRFPVLAIGSNGSTAQLVRKFGAGAAGSVAVYGTPVTVPGLQTRPSAHVGRSGYWPFAPVRLDDSPGPAVLCLLTAAQRDALDATEPNYTRRRLDPAAHPVPGFGVCEVYVSRHGVVDDARLPTWSVPPPSQESLLGALLGLLPGGLLDDVGDARGLSALLRSDGARCGEVGEAIRRHLHCRSAGLAVLGD
jgi:hypothetical protein